MTNKKMGYVIKPSGEILEVFPKNGKDFNLQEMYALVECDTIDIVSLADGRYMVVDDNGRSNKKPLNPKATGMYRNGRMSVAETKAAMEKKFAELDQDFQVMVLGSDADYNIVGNALVCDKSMIK